LKCATVSLHIGLLEVVKLYEVLISLSFKSCVSFSSVVLRLTVVCYLKCLVDYTVKKIFSRFVITTFFLLSNQLKSFI